MPLRYLIFLCIHRALGQLNASGRCGINFKQLERIMKSMKTHRLSGADTSSVTLVYIIRRGGTHHRFCRSASPFRTATP